MRVLVTGGAGFIGGALTRWLIANTSHEVLCLDALTYAGNLDSLSSVSESDRYHLAVANICDRTRVQAIFEDFRPEVVFHLAAESHVDRSIDGPAAFVQSNVVGTQVLLEEATEYWKGLSRADRERFRFQHTSTDEVFGDLGSSDGRFTETTPYAPSSPYAATKAASDHLVRAWHRTYGLPVVITNCSNNYGPYQFPEKLIPHMILRALDGKSLPVYGDGQQVRDWLFVEDHVRGLYAAAVDGDVGDTYLLGGDAERRNLEVVEGICRVLDAEVPDRRSPDHTSFSDLITFVADRPGHDVRYAVDASPAKERLGWDQSVDFEEGLATTVRWYVDNEPWWSRVVSGEYRLDRVGMGMAE